MQASAIVVKQADDIPVIHGIYSDLIENEMWLVSYTTWLNSTLGSRAELITPGNMFLLTTGTLIMKRVAQNKLTAPSTEAPETPRPRAASKPPAQPTASPQPPKSKDRAYREEVLNLVNSYNMVDEHTDYTVLE